MRNEVLKGLSEEQVAKVKACKNSDELLALAKQEGVELTSEQIEDVTGGGCLSSSKCPNCGSKDFRKLPQYQISGCSTYKCNQCGYEWSL